MIYERSLVERRLIALLANREKPVKSRLQGKED
jgi:hypothetical protein